MGRVFKPLLIGVRPLQLTCLSFETNNQRAAVDSHGDRVGAEHSPDFADSNSEEKVFVTVAICFIAAACQACHRLGDEGGGIGPDLTAAANRYTLRDLVENIVEPNKVIFDQYENSIIVLSDGSTVIGRITGEEGDILHVATNPNAPGQVSMVHQGNI